MRRFAVLALAFATFGFMAATPSHVLGQAGSDGGVIGKQNRSVSGSDSAGRSVQPGNQGQRRGYRKAAPKKRYQAKGSGGGGAAASGNVRVQGNCVYGSYAGYSGRVCY